MAHPWRAILTLEGSVATSEADILRKGATVATKDKNKEKKNKKPKKDKKPA